MNFKNVYSSVLTLHSSCDTAFPRIDAAVPGGHVCYMTHICCLMFLLDELSQREPPEREKDEAANEELI